MRIGKGVLVAVGMLGLLGASGAEAQGRRGADVTVPERAATEPEAAPSVGPEAIPEAVEPVVPAPDIPTAEIPEPAIPAPAIPTPEVAPLSDAGSDADYAATLSAAIAPCWAVSTLSPEEQAVSVTLDVRFSPDGVPELIQFVEASTDQIALFRAPYQVARRAVARCGAAGFDLPPERFDDWQNVQLTFLTDELRIQ